MKPKKKAKAGKKFINKQVPLAGLAIKHGFYLDALLILSSIMESRLRSVITRVQKENPGPGLSLERCIKRIKHLRLTHPDPMLEKTFDVQMIDSLRNWKNRRNDVLKDFTRIHVSKKRTEKLTQEGILLLRDLNSSSKKFKAEWKASLQSSSVPVP